MPLGHLFSIQVISSPTPTPVLDSVNCLQQNSLRTIRFTFSSHNRLTHKSTWNLHPSLTLEDAELSLLLLEFLHQQSKQKHCEVGEGSLSLTSLFSQS